jgi:hypothetical protein
MSEEKESGSSDEPRIIVDEDWKSQVEREKEELKREAEQATSQGEEQVPLPPANFVVLLSTLATQAMAGLGLLPNPMTGKPEVNRPIAKHFIDLVAMLEEKTKGNLTDEEASQVQETLHQLRMAFVATKQEQADTESSEPKKPTIELP